MIERVVPGLVLAAAIALVSYRFHALSRSGAAAATVVGTACVYVGWGWAALLIAFFVTGALLSRWRYRDKVAATSGVIEKPGARDVWQVVANGGVFTVAGVAGTVTNNPEWYFVGLGALSTAMADTWGTEVGTAVGGAPRSILTGVVVPPGTSGGVTIVGSLATLGGALLLSGLLVLVPEFSRYAWPVAVGGVVGAFADTVLGATIQERRTCPACGVWTERRVHRCGEPTVFGGGVRGVRNDVVNLISSVLGGGVALLTSGGL